MGFKEAFKKIGEKIQESIDTASKNYRFNSKLQETKLEILMKFKMEDLKRICTVKGISTKKLTTGQGDELSIGLTEIRKKDELAKRIAGKLTLKEIIQYAKKYGVSYQKELEDLEEFKKELFGDEKREGEEGYPPEEELKEEVSETEAYEEEITEAQKPTVKRAKHDFEELLSTIMDFKPETVRNEEDLEKQLYQFLSGKLSKRRIERQVNVNSSMKIDLVVDGKYGIELKIADTAQKLHTLTGQALFYKENLEEVIAVILDTGANVDIDKFVKKLEEYGVHVIRLYGTVKRLGRGKGDVIIIRRR